MADFTTVAILPVSGENSHFPVSKQTVKVQLSLDVLRIITSFTRGEQAIVNTCDCSSRLRLVLQNSNSLCTYSFERSLNDEKMFSSKTKLIITFSSWMRRYWFYVKNVHISRQNYQIELSFGTLYRSRKSKDKFVNQKHPIKIEGLSTTFVFLKITF